MFRHTNLTELWGTDEMRPETLKERAGHAHIQTTMQMYVHPSEEDIRQDWENAMTKKQQWSDVMIVSNFKPDVTNLKVREIETSLKSPWSDDVWLLSSQVFREYGKIEEKGTTKNSTIRFNSLPNLVSLEAKYFLFHGLSNYRYSIRTIYTYGLTYKRLGRFLEKYYSNINSFIEIPFEKALSKYKFFLKQEGISSIKANIHFFTTIIEKSI